MVVYAVERALTFMLSGFIAFLCYRYRRSFPLYKCEVKRNPMTVKPTVHKVNYLGHKSKE